MAEPHASCCYWEGAIRPCEKQITAPQSGHQPGRIAIFIFHDILIYQQSHLQSLAHLFSHVIVPYTWKLAREFTFGTQIQGHTAQTFLERAVNVNQSYPLPRDQLAATPDPVNDRVIANVVGLAVVAAVKYAKGIKMFLCNFGTS